MNISQVEARDSKEILLSVRGVFKTLGSSAVLGGIDLDVDKGKVLVSIGGNGAGKSTPMKIIMGIYRPDGGELVIADEGIHSFKLSVILAKGVYMAPQELILSPNVTMEENVLIGFEEKAGALRRRPLQIMDDIGWHLGLNREAMSLSIVEQQLVELLRGLLRNAGALILDGPTSALTSDEVGSLFKITEDLKQKDIETVHATHRLAEVLQITTHVAIMRDGTTALKGRVLDFTKKMLVKGLLPSNMDVAGLKSGKGEEKTFNHEGLKPVFELQGYIGYGFEDVNLKVYPDEVLGVAGVVGVGRTKLATTVLGKDKALGGKTILDGRDVIGYSTVQVLEAGTNYVPEGRRLGGLFVVSDVTANTTSSLLRDERMGRFFLDKRAEKEVAGRYIGDSRIRVTGQDQTAGSLSGENQQKIIIGRPLSADPKLVILGESIRGIDAVTRGDVHSIIHELKAWGAAIMPISSNMEEIVELSDWMVTIFSKRIKDELTRTETSQASLMVVSFSVTEE